MREVNLLDTSIDLKIVLAGPPRAGKTGILRRLYKQTDKRFRSTLTSYVDPDGDTLYFDHLRIVYGRAGNRWINIDVYTAPGSPELVHRRRQTLMLADLVVFVSGADGIPRHDAEAVFQEITRHLTADTLRTNSFPILFLCTDGDGVVIQPPSRRTDIRRSCDIKEKCCVIPGGRDVWCAMHEAVNMALEGRGITRYRRYEVENMRFRWIGATERVLDDRRSPLSTDCDSGRDGLAFSSSGNIVRIDPARPEFFRILADTFDRRGSLHLANKYHNRARSLMRIEGGGIVTRVVSGEAKNPMTARDRNRALTMTREFIAKCDIRRAMRALRMVSAGAPETYETLMVIKYLAWIKIRSGRGETGLNSLARLAGRFMGMGYHHEAAALFRRVLRTRPGSLECLLGASMAMEGMGRIVDSLAYLFSARRVMDDGKIRVGRSDVDKKIDEIERLVHTRSIARQG
ncbi:MAG: hypothetical protein JW885_04550 [Deltaproteobacteria bacterium]|nr:hypothetical protein [Candidatus Zymogenaceae bacterium]